MSQGVTTQNPTICCCCVEALTLDHWSWIIPDAFKNDADLQLILSSAAEPKEQRPPVYDSGKRFGHKLKISFVLSYHQSSCRSDCVFEWNEVQNVAQPGWPAGTSQNLVQTRLNQFPQWQSHLQQGNPCPARQIAVSDEDEPTIVVNPGDTGNRKLTITVVVRSSCPSGICKQQQLQLVIEQYLQVANGVPDFLYSQLTFQ